MRILVGMIVNNDKKASKQTKNPTSMSCATIEPLSE